MKVQTHTQNHSMVNFELRSLLLFSALLMASSFAAHAQQGSSAPQGVKAGTQVAAQATPTAIAHNRTSLKELDAAFNRGDTDHDGAMTKSTPTTTTSSRAPNSSAPPGLTDALQASPQPGQDTAVNCAFTSGDPP